MIADRLADALEEIARRGTVERNPRPIAGAIVRGYVEDLAAVLAAGLDPYAAARLYCVATSGNGGSVSEDRAGRGLGAEARPPDQRITEPARIDTPHPAVDWGLPPATREENLERIAAMGIRLTEGLIADLQLAAHLVEAIDADLAGPGDRTFPRMIDARDRLRAALRRRKLLE